MPNYSRKQSNDLAASMRLAELRELQSHLSSLIQDGNDELSDSGLDSSMHSSASLPLGVIESGLAISSVQLSGSRSSFSKVGTKTTTTPRYSRRASNDLAASLRLEELRLLQSQLSSVMQDENNELSASGLDNSNHSIASQISIDKSASGVDARIYHGSDSEHDIESDGMPSVYKPLHCGSSKNLTRVTSSQTLVTMTCHSTASSDDTKSDDSASNININQTAAGPKLLRQSWVARSKTFSRSKSSDLSKSNDSQLSVSRRSSIFAQMRSKKETSIDDLEKQSLTGQLPNYDFLTDSDKERSSLKANHHWWHGVFVLSLLSMVACIITLWAPYPIGARMPSSEIAKMPWSNGCIGTVKTCICPRETICADDLLSMIFLTIARASAWFDYPLYMLLFLSKCSNLNNFLQSTAARCWVNFSDSHKVHSLFGCIVAIETTSHSFFHLLRWARRSNDIQLLWTTKTGITGLIAFSLTPLIALPMAVPCLKKRMTFEWRKGKTFKYCCTYLCLQPQFWLSHILTIMLLPLFFTSPSLSCNFVGGCAHVSCFSAYLLADWHAFVHLCGRLHRRKLVQVSPRRERTLPEAW